MQITNLEEYVKNTYKNQMKHYGLNEELAKKLSTMRFKQMEELKKIINSKDIEINNCKVKIFELENRPLQKINNDLQLINDRLSYFLETNDNLKDLLSPECFNRDYCSGYQFALEELKNILITKTKRAKIN